MLSLTILNEAYLERVADVVADHLPKKTIVLISGPIGAGKTTLVRYLTQALGSTDVVRSPTYTVSHSYSLPDDESIAHLDLYRSTGMTPQAWADVEPAIDAAVHTFIEWPEVGHDWLVDRETVRLDLEPVSLDARVLRIKDCPRQLVHDLLSFVRECA